jgi:hypothetical protein
VYSEQGTVVSFTSTTSTWSAARGLMSVSSSIDGCWTKLWKLLCMCNLCWGLRQKKWRTQSTQPACMGNGESSCYSLHLIVAKIQSQCLGLDNRWLCNQTACNTGSCWCSALPRFPWRNASTIIGGCASTCAWEHEVSERQWPSQFCRLNA